MCMDACAWMRVQARTPLRWMLQPHAPPPGCAGQTTPRQTDRQTGGATTHPALSGQRHGAHIQHRYAASGGGVRCSDAVAACRRGGGGEERARASAWVLAGPPTRALDPHSRGATAITGGDAGQVAKWEGLHPRSRPAPAAPQVLAPAAPTAQLLESRPSLEFLWTNANHIPANTQGNDTQT